jgi:hypothetical protein
MPQQYCCLSADGGKNTEKHRVVPCYDTVIDASVDDSAAAAAAVCLGAQRQKTPDYVRPTVNHADFAGLAN